MEQRYANADRLERRTASAPQLLGGADADAVVITPNDADGDWMTVWRVTSVWRCRWHVWRRYCWPLLSALLLVNAVGIIALLACLHRCWRKCSARRLLARLMLAPLIACVDPLALRPNHSVADPRMDGSFHWFGDGADWRAIAAVAVAAP